MTFRENRLLHDSLIAAAEAEPDKTALVVDGQRLTYAELLDAARRFATALQGLGLERGDRVIVFTDNSLPCVVSIFGTALAGGVFVVANPQTKADKLAYILADSEAAFLVTEGTIARVASAASERAPSLKATIKAGGGDLDGMASFEELLAGAKQPPRGAGTIPLDLAALIYTSGSTGNPKGVMMTHGNVVFVAGSLSEYLRLGPEHRILNVLPLAFDYGLYQLLMSVRMRATLVLERSFVYPAQVLKRMEEEQVTVFPGVPTVYATLISMHEREPLRFPSVERVTNTAAALPPSFHDPLRDVFPNALIFRMYGLTECKRVSYLEPELLDEKPTSVGKAIPGTETLVLDEQGNPVRPGETGVLHVRGPHVMVGYWGLPDRTAEMLVDGPLPGERMLCTHDHFTIDEEGFLYFVGRSDDIIKSRGEKVSPAEVEDALYAISGVREAAVIGVPDELLGEAVHAYVALDEGSELSERDVIGHCRERLEGFMVPARVIFLDELPKTASGKIRKKGLVVGAGPVGPAGAASDQGRTGPTPTASSDQGRTGPAPAATSD
jgi:acyl-CoA synthetase (AMP-forming)/AMP-acid ligase II